jgi:hypothetical protein
MTTCNPQEVSTVNVSSLSPGDLFVFSGSNGKFMAMVVENDDQGRFLSWLHLTGPHAFEMDCINGGGGSGRGFSVLRVPLNLRDLRLQIELSGVSRTAEHAVGCLSVGEHPRIVTAFMSHDGSGRDADLWGVSLRDLSRDRLSPSYDCDEWRLVNVIDGQPAEIVASFSGGERPVDGLAR